MQESVVDRHCAGTILAICLGLFIALLSVTARAETDPKFYAVQASATVQSSPPQITIQWAADPNASAYTVWRKNVSDGSWGSGTALGGNITSFIDQGVELGKVYEYQVSKSTSGGYSGYGYVCAGIIGPLVEDRGTLLLLVDNLYAADLVGELSQLQQDLVGDGWRVVRHDVSRTDAPANIKAIIKADYQTDPTRVKAVFLFGHIPVPYSGDLNPDGHPDHHGAWPTDAYYGDVDGTWTDTSVNDTGAQRQANWNVPGDGKFDQSELPSDVELEVGRVDLSNMTCFANKTPARSEKDLLRQYLKKDHQFRHGLIAMERRGVICDNFGEKSGEAFAASGWRNFSAFFGADKVSAVPGWNYFSTVGSQSYLWSYGCGGGGYYTCDGVGSSDDFARTDIKSVFTMFLGSYFGDWDNESNFLRAPLGSTSSALAVAWAGRPHWFFHHMAMGFTIGYSARISQNNRNGGLYSAQNYATRGIHVGLLGDPALRMHPVLPPASLVATAAPGGMTLTWAASRDSDLQGYHLYRSAKPEGPFSRISGNQPITQTTFTDSGNNGGGFTYMVRAIKLEHSGSGTYLNPSQGIFSGNGGGDAGPGGGGSPSLPSAPADLTATAVSPSRIALSWQDTSNDELGFRLERKSGASGSFSELATFGAKVTTFTDDGLAAGTLYSYRVRAFNNGGESPRSNESSATTPSVPAVPAQAAFAYADMTTRGGWNTAYGNDGYALAGTTANGPAYAALNWSGASDWIWNWVTTDPRGLEIESASDRLAAAWYSETTFSIDLDLRDGRSHRIALYCVDWDTGERRQTIEVVEAGTGRVLDQRLITDFHGGRYLVWNVAGHVNFRCKRDAGLNAVINGIFFDPTGSAPNQAGAPEIVPAGGNFTEPTLVTLSSAMAGAVIHYTLDGSDPTASSARYTAPFLISTTATVRAKAFHDGVEESVTVAASFVVEPISTGQARAAFVQTDAATHGNWKGVYGSDGYQIVGEGGGGARLPAYATAVASGLNSYVWSDTSSDPRALQQAAGASRVAGCWYADSSFHVDVNLNDSRTHRLALYFLDWDRTGRVERVEIIDAESGAVVNSQTVADFAAGKYLVWDIKGNVRVRISRADGNNAVLMALFFGPAPKQLGS